jgi:hypothetical protein
MRFQYLQKRKPTAKFYPTIIWIYSFLGKFLILILRSSVQYLCRIQMSMLALSVENIFKVKPWGSELL